MTIAIEDSILSAEESLAIQRVVAEHFPGARLEEVAKGHHVWCSNDVRVTHLELIQCWTDMRIYGYAILPIDADKNAVRIYFPRSKSAESFLAKLQTNHTVCEALLRAWEDCW